MKTDVCRMLDIEYPIFAFSHCRDVVAAVSKAGGFVLGVSRHSAEELDVDLRWIRDQVGGRPFGVDLIFPAKTAAGETEEESRARIPEQHRRFVAELMERFGVPAPADTSSARVYSAHKLTTEHFVKLAEVALRVDIALLVSALGSPPAEVVAAARTKGVRLGALVGSPRHAERQIDAGVDILIAQGHEAGGHVGDISTLTLVPQVVDVARGRPVLAAGGIAGGRQIAAALAMGAQGVWLGTIWLTTTESDLHPKLVDRLLAATSEDTVVSRSYSGKPARLLRTPWVEAWEDPSAPPPLPTPLQGLLVRDAMTSAVEHGIEPVLGTPLGQVVGMLKRRETCAATINRLVEEFIDASEYFVSLLEVK
jgi:NAD(P)H-dependent flavin oxidoreductase YrpB (nitropropane dioxygenase family)